MIDPTPIELVAYLVAIQPELDEMGALNILAYDDGILRDITQGWHHQRTLAASLLDLHTIIEPEWSK